MANNPDSILHRTGCLGTTARFWKKSFAGDYIGLLVLLVACALLESFVEPFHRLFALDDVSLQFPHAERERVPVGMSDVIQGQRHEEGGSG
ncbi:MAG: hypothetical protein M1817_003219 [Caeruleum heppii]|nr:MAG: hypothetical protein M1817_003219 [Caeruleum heppii]